MASPTVNQLFATTLSNYHKNFADNVSNSNAVLALLKQGNRTRVVEGGKSIITPLTYDHEDSKWYDGTDKLDRALKETISAAEYSPYNFAVSITLTGPDLAKNRGRERILNLLEGKMDNAQATMNNNITKAIYSDGSLAKSFPGLKLFVNDTGVATVGGIAAGPTPPAQWPFWMNQFQSIARATGLQDPALKAGLNALWLKLIRGTEHPDLVLVDGEIYSTYESGLQENQRYGDTKVGGLGFEALKYKQASITYDSAATGLTGGYMLNTKYLKFEVYSGRNFEPLDLPDQSPDFDATTKHIAFMGCLTLSNRAMQGRILLTGT
jgi:hypothetical protein